MARFFQTVGLLLILIVGREASAAEVADLPQQVQVCNITEPSREIFLVVAYQPLDAAGKWQVEGWHTLAKRGDCQRVEGPFRSASLFTYAVSEDGREWKDEKSGFRQCVLELLAAKFRSYARDGACPNGELLISLYKNDIAKGVPIGIWGAGTVAEGTAGTTANATPPGLSKENSEASGGQPSSSITFGRSLISKAWLSTLPDRGGSLAIRGTGRTVAFDGQQVTVVDVDGAYDFGPLYNKETRNGVIKGDVVYAIDQFMFASFDDLLRYVKSIPEGQKFLVLLIRGREVLEFEREMPHNTRSISEQIVSLWKQVTSDTNDLYSDIVTLYKCSHVSQEEMDAVTRQYQSVDNDPNTFMNRPGF